ncbi:14413_t:CDS:2 [Cetraspora pellucida]|uniref:14413_t:CDS:1 n=1 Tax=Cetraspora pellucida TaxID=1433469 RepID=A0A9N9FWW3_9GLOM|nr:14413_t:CDS:2 [Cetraspora pellucida]
MSFFSFFEHIPTISSTVLKHYTEGPPKKSWDLKFHLAIALIKGNDRFSKTPIEQSQKEFEKHFALKTPPNITIKGVILDDEYRQKSKTYLEKILKPYDDVLDDKWKDPNDKGLYGEWLYINEKINETDNVILYLHGGGFCFGSPKTIRIITQKFTELAGSRVFAPDYRLSPQSQFPAALCDSIAAYLYLINPGPNAGFEPINPKRIILAGESAGGNLVFTTILSLRDAELPLPAGAIVLVDLTQSMPSKWNPELDKVDYVPSELDVFIKLPLSPAMNEFHADAKALADKIALKNPKIVSHPSFTEVPRFQLYCANEAIYNILISSPMLAESLGNLPPILCQVGGDEKFRDEAVLICHKAASPHEYQLPSYATENFEKSPFKKPTKVILEVYDDMPHAWHMFTFSKPSQIAIERCCDFIKRVASIEDNNTSTIDLIKEETVSPSISVSSLFIAMRVGTDGKIRELNETDRDCLKWDNIGVVPKPEN